MKDPVHEERLRPLLADVLHHGNMEAFFMYVERCADAIARQDDDVLLLTNHAQQRYAFIHEEKSKGVVSYQDYLLERNRVVESLEQLLRRIPEELTIELSQAEYARYRTGDVTLSEAAIRRTILNYVKSYGFKAGIRLLDMLEAITPDIRRLDEQYQQAHWQFNHQDGETSLSDWLAQKENFQTELETRIQHSKLPDNAAELQRVAQRLIQENENPTLPQPELYFLLFPEAEAIEALVHDHAGVDKAAYRRLLHLAQNAYKVGDYQQAYTYCEQILTTIEPESPQLYEYLLLNFRQLKRQQDIVQQALLGNDRDLRQLFVYVGRIKSLDAKGQGVQKTLRQQTIHELADYLAIGLQRAVQQVSVNGLWLPPDNGSVEEPARKTIEQYLEIGSQITRYTEARPAVVNALVNELAGGGHFAWITPGKHYQSLINKREFPALSFFQNLRDLTPTPEAKADQATQVYNNLIRLHDGLRAQRTRQNLPEYFAYTARWVTRCVTAYFLFDGNAAFLRLAYDNELTAEEGLEWLELDDNGDLVARAVTWQHEQLDVVKVFDFIVRTLFGEKGWDDRRRELKRTVCERMDAATHEAYQYIRQHTDTFDEAEGRRYVIRCIRYWRRLFKATHRIVYVEQYILPELLGAGVYQWFTIRVGDTAMPLAPIHYPDFQPQQVLEEMLTYTVNHDDDTVRRDLAANLFYHQVMRAYQALDPFHAEAEEQRKELLQLMEKALWLYTLDPQPDRLQLVYDELMGEQKYTWLAITAEGITDGQTWYGAEALPLLEQLSQVGTPIATRYEWDTMLQTLAKRHYRQMERSYKEDFDDLRRHNWRAVDRLQMVRLLQQCVALYRATNRVQYLFHPYHEWVEHSGKIRWRWRFLLLEWERRQNHEVGNFHYYRERREVLDALSMYSKHHLPWSNR